MRRRRWLLLGVLWVSACPGPVPGVPDGGELPALCSHRCATCALGEVCATGGGMFSRHVAACLRRCTSRSDCGASERCVQLYGEELAVCISLAVPSRCPGADFDPRWHCDFPPAHCQDGKILLRPFSQPENQTCGSELVTCPVSCDAADGGTIPSGECR